ncbi:MAG: hypothetical protein JWM11_3849, partial [Planctomycetaceae bacterium]|nr:hypothetical protein [Planctomycetaceae bacterium]
MKPEFSQIQLQKMKSQDPHEVQTVLTYRELSPRSLGLSGGSMRFGRHSALWLIMLCVWFSGTHRAIAQTPPIDVDVERMYSIRSEAPITLRVRMTPSNPALVEGHLEFRLTNGNDLLSTLITHEEIINPPAKTARYVLPAQDSPGYSQQLDLYMTFVTKQGRYKFDPQSLIVPKYRERDLIVGVVSPANKVSSTELDALQQGLKLEGFTPVDQNKAPVDKTVHTVFSNFAPDQLPPDATSYCSFNMVLIAAEGFAALKESQWPALLDWVEAGGSLCLMPGTDLTTQHIEALNRLVKHRGETGIFSPGPNNELVVKDEDSGKRHILLRRG